MKELIVNADDFGADQARNAGICEAVEARAVTSVSILPNGPALEDACRKIRSWNRSTVSVGIHLNLSEGKSVAEGLKLITKPDGSFLGKEAVRRLLVHRGNRQLEYEIRSELTAQIMLLRDNGIRLDHIDGHQHVHIFPAVISLALEAAKRFGIPWMRIPEERENLQTGTLPSALVQESRLFSGYAEAARPLAHASGIFTTEHFRGLCLKGRLRAALWMEVMGTVPHGLTELMVHPGHIDQNSAFSPFSRFSTSDRELELEALIDKRFRESLLKTGIKLSSFPEASI